MSFGSVAVVGGGINGLCIAWELARRGWQVELFERNRCLTQTSSASTKLLHGGLRYLEQGHLALVAESLRERARWLREVPQHCHWLPLLLPIYKQQARPAWHWRLGLGLYDGLALGQLPGFARWLNPDAVLQRQPGLKADGLLGAWQFWDGQMDEQALGGWVERQARSVGVVIYEHSEVQRVDAAGDITAVAPGFGDGAPSLHSYTWVVNACGPWAVELLERSGIPSPVQLDLVRGSHLLVPPPPGVGLPDEGFFVEVPGSRRIAFLLPYKGDLLVGTTEQAQQLNEPARANLVEQEQLLGLVSHYLPAWLPNAQQHGRWFTGLRPIVRSRADVSSASREADVQRYGRLLTVFGGKWTTARALAERFVSAAPFNGQP
jgi:glycerol-3-phosphate dehydrogenase